MSMSLNYRGNREQGFGGGLGSCDEDTHGSVYSMGRVHQAQGSKGGKGEWMYPFALFSWVLSSPVC